MLAREFEIHAVKYNMISIRIVDMALGICVRG